jgi:hypothetical protein
MWKPLFLILLMIPVGCTASPTGSPVPFLPTPDWENPLQLHYAETVTLSDGFQIQFTDVIEDTRCPVDAPDCSEANNAQVLLLIRDKTGTDHQMFLNTNPSLARSARIGGHDIWLEEVHPAPPPVLPLDKTKYEIWISVLLL